MRGDPELGGEVISQHWPGMPRDPPIRVESPPPDKGFDDEEEESCLTEPKTCILLNEERIHIRRLSSFLM